MEKLNKTVMGTFAPPPRPDWRGFVVLGLVFGGPVVTLLFGVEIIWRWWF